MIEDVKAMCLNSQQVLDIATSTAKFSAEEIETIIIFSSAASMVVFMLGILCCEAIRIIRLRALFYKNITKNHRGINLMKFHGD